MKYFVFAFVAVAVAFTTGCTPKLASRPLGAEETAWKNYIEPMYPGWKVPATLPPAIAEAPSDAASFAGTDNLSLPEPAAENAEITVPVETDGDNSLTADSDNSSNAVRYEEYIVQKDESLSIIAKKVYGNGRKYYRILKANEDVIKNQNRIYPGMKLRIPRP